MKDLPQEALVQVAAYFQALAEPTRLRLLNLLREQERSVGELAQLTGFSAAKPLASFQLDHAQMLDDFFRLVPLAGRGMR